MIDFSAVKKYIYFPRKIERRNEPYIIHVLDKWGLAWRGNADLDKLLTREFVMYEIMRCQPYSEELWKKCVAWMEARAVLESQYLDLMNGGSQ